MSNNENKQVINMRVEFEATPIRHAAIQCPYCKKWFHGEDVTQDKEYLSFDYQLKLFTFFCPICSKEFGRNYSPNPWDRNRTQPEYNIQEVSGAEECYKDCATQKVIWE